MVDANATIILRFISTKGQLCTTSAVVSFDEKL